MIIPIHERWQIRRMDALNFVIEYFQEGGITPKTGEKAADRWVIKGHYSGLPKAIAALPSHIPFDPKVADFGMLCLMMDGIASRLERQSDELVHEMERVTRDLAKKLADKMKG